MKKTDDIRVWAYSSANGKEISKFFIDGSMGQSDFTNLLQIKKSMLNRIPKNYYEKKIIINIHNLTSGSYNTFIVKNPNEKPIIQKSTISRRVVKLTAKDKKINLLIKEIRIANNKFLDRKVLTTREKNLMEFTHGRGVVEGAKQAYKKGL